MSWRRQECRRFTTTTTTAINLTANFMNVPFHCMMNQRLPFDRVSNMGGHPNITHTLDTSHDFGKGKKNIIQGHLILCGERERRGNTEPRWKGREKEIHMNRLKRQTTKMRFNVAISLSKKKKNIPYSLKDEILESTSRAIPHEWKWRNKDGWCHFKHDSSSLVLFFLIKKQNSRQQYHLELSFTVVKHSPR